MRVLKRWWPHVAVPLVVVAVVVVVVRAIGTADCADCLRPEGGGTISTSVRVVGESGEALAGAKVVVHAPLDHPTTVTTGDDGVAAAPELTGPALAVVDATDHLPEPVPLGWSDNGKTVTVTLLNRGNRIVVHSAGDVMFGGRYTAPSQDDAGSGGEPLIPDQNAAAGAENVVSAIAPAFAAADFRTVDLSTAFGDKPAYPGKRSVLRSAAPTVAGLTRLSTDLAVMANEHARDLGDPGISDTRAALAQAKIASVGAGANEAEAVAPFHADVRGTGLGVLAYTTVDGSNANSKLPGASVKRPETVLEKDEWQYASRSWGFPTGGVPVASRRARDAWDKYRAAEAKLKPEQAAQMWASLAQVYPELQDWVARRGHGGAALWDDASSTRQIQQASATSPLLMVHLHAGYLFQDSAADVVRSMAHKAIDAGADVVVADHPHVVQGVEWYKGKLIAYSLGNLVFDQNALASFSGTFLRTVWEGDKLVQARLFPVELVDYKPVPVTDAAAVDVLTRVQERSALPTESFRSASGEIHTRRIGTPVAAPRIVVEHNTGRIATEPVPEVKQQREIKPHETVDLPGPLVKPLDGKGIDVGRDLYGWGHFEDYTADGVVNEAVHWDVDSKREGARSTSAATGLRGLRLEAKNDKGVQSRPISRIPVPRHRDFTETHGKLTPADPDPTYSVTARVRRSGTAIPEIRFDISHTDEANPTEDPTADPVTSVTKPLDVPADGQWHTVTVDLAPSELDKGSRQGNVVLPYLRLPAPNSNQVSWLDVDDFRFIEWREAAGTTSAYGAYDVARNRTDVALTLPYTVLGQH
ncbi:CapA family protein [Actinokineospora inagensis]|uniref:CapA family protein n=1 Tax=Actinokineospora inagensis TaxID=103730 RepID=UPI000422E70C|nr:CapA family protein [Actinokineospora inagensis]